MSNRFYGVSRLAATDLAAVKNLAALASHRHQIFTPARFSASLAVIMDSKSQGRAGPKGRVGTKQPTG
jgi:hypothetical protein